VEADFKPLEQDVGEIVAAAVKFADESPFPEPSALHRDVMVED
jgi:pyruvate dehydrogenase E1 component alpha subunit